MLVALLFDALSPFIAAIAFALLVHRGWRAWKAWLTAFVPWLGWAYLSVKLIGYGLMTYVLVFATVWPRSLFQTPTSLTTEFDVWFWISPFLLYLAAPAGILYWLGSRARRANEVRA